MKKNRIRKREVRVKGESETNRGFPAFPKPFLIVMGYMNSLIYFLYLTVQFFHDSFIISGVVHCQLSLFCNVSLLPLCSITSQASIVIAIIVFVYKKPRWN